MPYIQHLANVQCRQIARSHTHRAVDVLLTRQLVHTGIQTERDRFRNLNDKKKTVMIASVT